MIQKKCSTARAVMLCFCGCVVVMGADDALGEQAREANE